MCGLSRRLKTAVIAIAPLIFFSSPLPAAVSSTFTYQGSLKQSGTPVTGTYSMEFRITNSTGALYWTSGAQSISILDGLYKANLVPTGINWATSDPYLEVKLGGTTLLPREKLTSSVYAIMAKELDAGATAQGPLSVIDSNVANGQNELTLSAESSPSGSPFQMQFGYRVNTPSIQSYRVGVGTQNLQLNPDGGNVAVGTTTAQEKLDVGGNIRSSGGRIFNESHNGVMSGLGKQVGHNATSMNFDIGNTECGLLFIYANGSGNTAGAYKTFVIGTTSSNSSVTAMTSGASGGSPPTVNTPTVTSHGSPNFDHTVAITISGAGDAFAYWLRFQ